MPFAGRLAAAAALTTATVVAGAIAPAPGRAAASAGPRLTASWGAGARPGGRAPLQLSLTVPPRAPVVDDVRIFLSAGVDLASSRLGDEACRIPPEALAAVLVGRPGGDPAVPAQLPARHR